VAPAAAETASVALAPEGTPGGREPAGRELGGDDPARVALMRVTRAYDDRPVLDDFTRAFPPGRLTVVTGRSGSGKTTLLRLIAGLDRPDGGQITIDGTPLSGRDAEELASLRRRRIGVMTQDPAPVAFLSAHENIALALRLRGWEQAAAARRATVVLDLVGLSERSTQRAFRLSAGEVQRLALARALASAGGLVLVDEPTSRLDEVSAATVAALLARAATEGQTVICASHDPVVIERGDELLALE
jgi:putative ABC transport system ATP-binding protein